MKRSYQKLLNEYCSLFPVVAIIGPRQCGKTTLCHFQGEDWKYFDLEKPSDYDLISQDIELFFRLNSDKVIIDEAQMLPELFAVLRGVIDSDRSKKGRFILTGSSSPQLLSSVSESLAGRIGLIQLSPFSYCETVKAKGQLISLLKDGVSIKQWPDLLDKKGDLGSLFDFWYRGGYPEPWLENSQRFSQVWMDQYIETYVYRDIARLFPNLNKERFRKFVRLLSSLSGNVLNYSDIARSLDISQPTIKDYFEIVDGTFIWRQIPAFSQQSIKRLVKHPKGYFRDSGLLHHLQNISSLEQLQIHIKMGESWESLVIEEILRQCAVEGISVDYSYYRTSAGSEVDLILESGFGMVPIEIKFNQALKKQHTLSLKKFMQEFNVPFGIVVNNSETVRLVDENIISIPVNFL